MSLYGDFYYEDNASYRKYFGKFAEKYGFKGAFDGMMHHFETREVSTKDSIRKFLIILKNIGRKKYS